MCDFCSSRRDKRDFYWNLYAIFDGVGRISIIFELFQVGAFCTMVAIMGSFVLIKADGPVADYRKERCRVKWCARKKKNDGDCDDGD